MMQRLVSMASTATDTTRSLSGRATGKTPNRSLRSWLTEHREGLLIGAILLIAALAHGINMFDFPYYETDEGTYMSQAWAVINEGELAPYTYIYDHAPMGWLQIAAWTLLTGGFDTFGTAVESGRVLMLLLQVGSTFMLYRIARNLTGSVAVASVVALFFALSAYGILYHRRVLLDNIATFWMLLGLLLLVSPRLSLSKVWLSAVAIGVSVLSKEIVVVVVPVLILFVFFSAHRSQRWFAAIGWTAIVGSIVSTYLLQAILRNELLPTGWLPGDEAEHVSLIETLQWQASRGKDGGILAPDSKFWDLTLAWVSDDPLLVVGGTLCAAISLLAIWRRPLVGLIGAVTLAFWVFLGRGGEILTFYLLPLLPLLALNIGLVLDLVARKVRAAVEGSGFGRVAGRGVRPVVAALCLPLILGGYWSTNLGTETVTDDVATGYVFGLTLWESEQSVGQKQALDWIEANIEPDSSMIIDNYMWTELHEGQNGEEVYERAHWYWKAELDPEIKYGVFDEDWRNVDYVVATDQLLRDTQVEGLGLVDQALINSTPVVRFNTDGWPVEVRRVDKS